MPVAILAQAIPARAVYCLALTLGHCLGSRALLVRIFIQQPFSLFPSLPLSASSRSQYHHYKNYNLIKVLHYLYYHYFDIYKEHE